MEKRHIVFSASGNVTRNVNIIILPVALPGILRSALVPPQCQPTGGSEYGFTIFSRAINGIVNSMGVDRISIHSSGVDKMRCDSDCLTCEEHCEDCECEDCDSARAEYNFEGAREAYD